MGLITLSLSSQVPKEKRKKSQVPCLPAARMWPYITEAGERKARDMLPDMLDKNKPTWMTTLKLNECVFLTVMVQRIHQLP